MSVLESLKRKLQKRTVEAVPYDPSGLDDPVATKTGWGPAKGGGASFRTHRLADDGPGRMAFKATAGARAFYLLFLLVGLAVMIGFTLAVMNDAAPSVGESGLIMLFPMFIGAVFAIAGGAMLYVGSAPIVFDTRRGEYWKGRVAPSEVINRAELKEHAPLDRIHALQLISEHCRSSDSSYYSYELNLVLDDGSRLNVVDHGNRDELRADADRLGELLGKPVWDATE